MEPFGELLLPEWKNLPALGEREVQVFALRAEGDAGLLARAERLLSRAERERAARFRVELPRQEFMVGRAALRVLLASALLCPPESLTLEADAFGKPFAEGVYSNVSHSKGLVYVALCRAAPVGVDVEWIDPNLEALEIASANFLAEESARIAAEPAGWLRALAFCRLWTRKEAVVKAHGRGLQIPLCDVRVPEGDEGFGWIETDGHTEQAYPERFSVRELPAPPGFTAAVAVQAGLLSAIFIPSLQVFQKQAGVL